MEARPGVRLRAVPMLEAVERLCPTGCGLPAFVGSGDALRTGCVIIRCRGGVAGLRRWPCNRRVAASHCIDDMPVSAPGRPRAAPAAGNSSQVIVPRPTACIGAADPAPQGKTAPLGSRLMVSARASPSVFRAARARRCARCASHNARGKRRTSQKRFAPRGRRGR